MNCCAIVKHLEFDNCTTIGVGVPAIGVPAVANGEPQQCPSVGITKRILHMLTKAITNQNLHLI